MIIDTNWHDLTGCPGYLLAWMQFNNNLSQNFVASVQSQAQMQNLPTELNNRAKFETFSRFFNGRRAVQVTLDQLID